MLISMTVLLAFVVSMSAMAVGYVCGRRAGTARSTWKRRTSRVELGKRAVSLVVLIAARRIRRSAWAGLPEPSSVAPLHRLRGGVTRMRSYRGVPGW